MKPNKETIWDYIDQCIEYVVDKIYSWNTQTFEQEVIGHIKHYADKYRGIELDNQTAYNIYVNNQLIIRDAVKDKEYRLKEEGRKRLLYAARSGITEKVQTNKTKSSRTQFDNLTYIKPLNDHDKQLMWDEYSKMWDEKHPYQPSTQPQRKPRLIDTFDDKLNKHVVYNHEKLLSLDEFKQLTHNWSTSRPIEEWYKKYIDRFYKQADTHTEYPVQQLDNTIGFKSPNKIKALKSLYPDKTVIDNDITSYFPLKQNLKNYQLHKVSKHGTYLIDLMFNDKLCYLIAINVNTKYLFAELMNNVLFNGNDTDTSNIQRFSKASKTAETFVKTLDRLIKSGMNVKYLSGDGESAFDSKSANVYYITHGISFKPVPRIQMGHYPDFMKREQKQVKTDPMHGSLGIIDRVIRTIRDIAYNLQVSTITPDVMKEIVNQYNNAPHKTLSKYAGFDVSPKMVQFDQDLEEFIVRRICQENYIIMNRPGFRLKPNTQVKLYNEHDSLMKRRSIIKPGTHHIVNFKNGLYEVIDDKNNIQLIPRYKIAYA
mgnify:CR=1 FL=1